MYVVLGRGWTAIRSIDISGEYLQLRNSDFRFLGFHVLGKGISLLNKNERCLWERADFQMYTTRK